MPEFVLDHGTRDAEKLFSELDAFTKGYIEAAFWLLDEEIKDATLADLSAEALAAMKEDCADFNLAADAWLDKAYAFDRYGMNRAGVDFWLTRNGHGAGFWDRGLGAAGDKLTEIAHGYGSCDLYRGDDGNLYVM